MDARTLVRADALFEAALGLALIVGAATGALGPADFPHPVGTPLIVAAGCILLVLAAVLWTGAISIAALAIGNAITPSLALTWLLAASGFSAAGTALVAVTAAGLVTLAAAQGVATRWAILDSNQGPPPYQSGALTD
jgi:hypothetical protein